MAVMQISVDRRFQLQLMTIMERAAHEWRGAARRAKTELTQSSAVIGEWEFCADECLRVAAQLRRTR